MCSADIFAGFNVLILLLELHRYAQTQDELKDKINFHPCGQPDTDEFDRDRLLRIMGYSQCLDIYVFKSILGAFLSGANLSRAMLWGAMLSRANLSEANLSLADLEALQWDSETQWRNAIELHEAVRIPSELAQHPPFQAAVSLSQGMIWVQEGKVEDAIQAYEQAQTLDPNLQISAWSWNNLYWLGCLHGYASQVLIAGDKAVELEPDNKNYQDSRGLARGLTGDLAGAKADFQAVLDSGYFDKREKEKQRRERWVEVLEAGYNPFTPEELQALRREYGLSAG